MNTYQTMQDVAYASGAAVYNAASYAAPIASNLVQSAAYTAGSAAYSAASYSAPIASSLVQSAACAIRDAVTNAPVNTAVGVIAASSAYIIYSRYRINRGETANLTINEPDATPALLRSKLARELRVELSEKLTTQKYKKLNDFLESRPELKRPIEQIATFMMHRFQYTEAHANYPTNHFCSKREYLMKVEKDLFYNLIALAKDISTDGKNPSMIAVELITKSLAHQNKPISSLYEDEVRDSHIYLNKFFIYLYDERLKRYEVNYKESCDIIKDDFDEFTYPKAYKYMYRYA